MSPGSKSVNATFTAFNAVNVAFTDIPAAGPVG